MARQSKKALDAESAFYALVVIGLIALLVWRWWEHSHASKPVIIAAKPSPVTNAPISPTAIAPISGARPVATALEVQIALVREGISPGSIDGKVGSQTRAALTAFQRKHNLDATGSLDATTRAQLLISPPILTEYTVTTNDLDGIRPAPKTWLEKSEQPRLGYANILELLGEKAFAHPQLIRALNPSIDWTNVTAGTRVVLPNVAYPSVTRKAAAIDISLRDCTLEAFDTDSNLLVHFPCSIGHIVEKRPVGELHVENIALNPNYTFDPALYPESPEAKDSDDKLIIPPGPRNPVGVAWIGLDRPGYGMHGTPVPENVGRTESHGCFRLANWNADYLAHLVWVGLPVTVNP